MREPLPINPSTPALNIRNSKPISNPGYSSTHDLSDLFGRVILSFVLCLFQEIFDHIYWHADNHVPMITTGVDNTIKQPEPVEAKYNDTPKLMVKSAPSETSNIKEPGSTSDNDCDDSANRTEGLSIIGRKRQRNASENSIHSDTQQKLAQNEHERLSNQPHKHSKKKKISVDNGSTPNSESDDSSETMENNMKLCIKDGKFNCVISMQGNIISPTAPFVDEITTNEAIKTPDTQIGRDRESKCESESSVAKKRKLSPLRIRISQEESEVTRLSPDSITKRTDEEDTEKSSYSVIKSRSSEREDLEIVRQASSEIGHLEERWSKCRLKRPRSPSPVLSDSTSHLSPKFIKLESITSKTSQPSTRPVLSSTLSVNGQYSRSAADDLLVRERAWELVEQLTEQNEVNINLKLYPKFSILIICFPLHM